MTVDYELIADKGKVTHDYNRGNNQLKSDSYRVDFALELVGVKQKDPKDIRIAICPSAIQFMSQYNVTANDIIESILEWNTASGGKIVFKPFISLIESPDAKIRVISGHVDKESTVAQTSFMSFGEYFFNTITITFNTNHGSWGSYNRSRIKAVIKHEAGHTIGLGDSYCLDRAVMHAYVGQDQTALSYTDHDLYNLNYIY